MASKQAAEIDTWIERARLMAPNTGSAAPDLLRRTLSLMARMGATHFLMRTLPKVATEMALHVLAYNLTRVMNIMAVQPLMVAMRV